jgi:Sortase domain
VPDKRLAGQAVPWILAGASAALIGGGALIASTNAAPPASALDHQVTWPGRQSQPVHERTQPVPGRRGARQPAWHTPTITIPGRGTTQIVAEAIGRDLSLGVPADVHKVGWDVYSAAMASAAGTTVLDGHVNYAGQGAGFFSGLASTRPGELITTTSPAGIISHWRVTSDRLYPKDRGLSASLFSPGGPRRLVLISCGGAFDWRTGHYLSNVVVVAAPA